MSNKKPSKFRVFWLIPPIVIGVAVFVFMKTGKQAPTKSDAGEPTRVVRTLEIQRSNFTPIAEGFGVVQPAQVWQAVSQVSGRIVATHERLRNGEIIQKGELLFQVDPVDYELLLVQSDTQLAELDVQMNNTKASLKIEERNLALVTSEYERQKKLAKQGSISRSSVDSAQRTMLNSQAQVQNLKNTLSLIPTQKKLQKAKITQAQRDLSNTKVTAPFNLAVSGLAIEMDQFVSKGQVLLSGDSLDRVEIIAQVSLSSLKNLFIDRPQLPNNMKVLSSSIKDIAGFKPEVVLDMGNDNYARWDAEFVRFSDAVDSETRTMGVVVAVDKPLSKTIPGIRPPLSKGMFVEILISGHTQENTIAIPSSAIRNNNIYVLSSDNRLEIREIQTRYDQQGKSIVSSGLQAGEQLVLSDIIPAVQGMLLKAKIQKPKKSNQPSGE